MRKQVFYPDTAVNKSFVFFGKCFFEKKKQIHKVFMSAKYLEKKKKFQKKGKIFFFSKKCFCQKFSVR